MDRVSFPFFLVLFIAGLSTAAAVKGGSTNSPPAYSSHASLVAPSYSSGPVSYDFVPYLASSLANNSVQWPEKYPSTTTVEEAFGSDAEQVYGSVSLLDGVSAKGEDGYSQLLKEGVAALLNSIDKHFQFSEDDVKKSFSFNTSLSSEATASEQAHQFADANMLYVTSHS